MNCKESRALITEEKIMSYIEAAKIGIPGEFIFDDDIAEIFIGTTKRLIKEGKIE